MRGNSSSTALISCRHTMSGETSESHLSKAVMRALTPLMFQVAIRMGGVYHQRLARASLLRIARTEPKELREHGFPDLLGELVLPHRVGEDHQRRLRRAIHRPAIAPGAAPLDHALALPPSLRADEDAADVTELHVGV